MSLRENKKEGEYCVDKKNNCEEGLSCIWDKQPNGVGKCSSRPGNSQMKEFIICLYTTSILHLKSI